MEVTRTFDLIDWNCEKYPRDIMFGGKIEKEWVTYSTKSIKNLTDNFSYGLFALGYRKGDHIATITGNKAEWNIVDHGIAQCGMIHVPIYPTISSEEYSFILDHSEVKAVFVANKQIYSKVKAVASEIPAIKEIFSFDKTDGLRTIFDIIELGKKNMDKYMTELATVRNSINPSDMVTIIYTSGTTGTSKGVMLSHKNIISNAIATSYAHAFGFGFKALSFLPLCHVYERMMNYNYQFKGTSVYYVENMGAISEVMREIKPNICNVVPRLLEKIYDNIIGKGKNLPWIKKQIFFWAVNLGLKYRLRGNSKFYKFRLYFARKLVFRKWKEALGGEIGVMVSGGAALQSRLEHIFWAAGIPVLQGYGLTETAPVIAVNPFRLPDIKLGTVGPVLDGVTVKIAEDGEILCKGPNVMMGYFKAPELTAEAIDREGFYHTGDIGRIEDGRFLRITDRKKEMFKLSAGKYIAPQTIENRLKESFFIEQAMVIGEHQKFASALLSPNFTFLHDWCFLHKIQFRDNAELIELPEIIERYAREVREVNKVLSEYEQIKRFRLVTEEWAPQTGELSPTLKLKRNIIRQRYGEMIKEIYLIKEKENPVDKVVERIRNSVNGILKNLPKF
jgi:long-chain acyl-CoA synthetase